MIKLLLLWAAIAITSVLPPIIEPRSRVSRLSRGASGDQFKKLAVSKELLEQAQQAIKGRQRIAVFSADDSDSRVVALMLNSALPYAKNFLLADPSTVAVIAHVDATAKNAEIANNAKWAEQLALDWLAVCRPKESGDRVVEVFQINKQGAVLTETIVVSTVSVDEIQKACQKVFGLLKADFGKYSNELKKLPTTKKDALLEVVQGYQLILASVGVQDDDQRNGIAEEGLRLSQSALAKEPSLLQAILLQASCLDILKKPDALKAALEKGFKVRNLKNTDRLTMLEFEGDYARYVKKDREQATTSYSEMLEIDPNHLRAHWSLIETALDEPVGNVDNETLQFAVEHLVAILAAHPGSPLALVVGK